MPAQTETRHPRGNRLVAENVAAIRQLTDLLTRLPATLYQAPAGNRNQHVTGKHVRHIIDHYDAFLRAAARIPGHAINYEHRERSVVLESDPLAARDRLQVIVEALGRLQTEDNATPLDLEHPGDTGTTRLTSTIGRELVFLSSHTIHHMAIVGLLVELNGVVVDEDFGVHPSTLRHQQHGPRAQAANA